MSKFNLSIDEADKSTFLNLLKTQRETLKAELSKVEKLISKLESGISNFDAQQHIQSERPSTQRTTTSANYKSSWSWALKSKFVLNQVGRCLTARDILEEVQKIDPTTLDTTIGTVSGTLSNKATKGIVFNRYKPYGGEYYYGLIDWFTEYEDGTVEPDEEYKAV